jgi:hypothetical protein
MIAPGQPRRLTPPRYPRDGKVFHGTGSATWIEPGPCFHAAVRREIEIDASTMELEINGSDEKDGQHEETQSR